jgi:YYY domain-containing protein
VLEDLDLLGRHVEVIDEFPMFSYLLGDNHPHVLAMPVVLLVIGLAMNLLFRKPCDARSVRRAELDVGDETPVRWAGLRGQTPLGWIGLALYAAFSGALIFLNTWDYPPYWLLLVVCAGMVGWFSEDKGWWRGPLLFGVALAVGTVVIYLPYFVTAQSQAGGIAPNLFNPTRLPQFLVMFGQFLPALGGLVVLGWPVGGLRWSHLAMTAGVVMGLPVAFLAVSAFLATRTGWGTALLAGVALPEGAASHWPFIVQRWSQAPWTLLLVGAALSLVIALIWYGLERPGGTGFMRRDRLFALALAALGLALVYAPEFLFLRDNFGTRMNTVFKFYYQGWLLLGLAAVYAIGAAFRGERGSRQGAARGLCLMSLALMALGLLYPMAGVYSKTGGFQAETPTFDATAYVSDAERAAIEWVRDHTMPGTLVLEGKGASYWATYNRISTMTGRPTLLGWDGHQSQWRGDAYGEMAGGRAEALDTIYRTGRPSEIADALDQWQVDYVYVGPTEIEQYGITPERMRLLAEVMDLVYENPQVAIFRAR